MSTKHTANAGQALNSEAERLARQDKPGTPEPYLRGAGVITKLMSI